MFIISSRAGQLGNTLQVFANFIAFSIENDLRLFNPTFDRYARFFQFTAANSLCSYPPLGFNLNLNKTLTKVYYGSNLILAGSRLFKTIKVINSRPSQQPSNLSYTEKNFIKKQGNLINFFAGDKPFNLVDPSLKEYINRKEIIFFQGALMRDGWYMNDRENLRKHANAVKAYFTPIDEHRKKVSELISRVRKNADIVIGVHLRQGDYKEHMQGKYFYDTEEYINLIKSIKSRFGNKNVKFLICSNVRQDSSLFTPFDCVFANRDMIEDMYSLAECDYIIGPPSTYTMWASFYGDKPFYMIRDSNKIPKIEDFVPYYDWKGILHYRDDWCGIEGLGGSIQTFWEWTH